MKYAIEVAKAGSLSKASEKLLIAQPNISRSIKELEADLGIAIFERTAKGMVLTPDGEKFIGYAHEIVNQIEQVENLYKAGSVKKQRFSVSVPRASYISEAFALFSKSLTADVAEIFYKETNSQTTISNILDHDYKLGIIRYAENYDKYFKSMLEEKGLSYELIAEFSYQLIMNTNSPLASMEKITFDDLSGYIEIAHTDSFVPSLPLAKVSKEELPDNINRRIFLYERAGQFDLLHENSETFMWVSPMPKRMLERYDLVMKECVDNKKVYKDVLVYRKGYKLTELDQHFITEVCKAKRRYI